MNKSPQKAAFLDRDGVINYERDYVHRIEDFEIIPGVPEGLKHLTSLGFALVIVTNQAGIAKGKYGVSDYHRVTAHMLALLAAQGIAIAGVYHCPHHPEGIVPALSHHCVCRKPAPGMLFQASHDLRLDLPRSILVGDKTSDIVAGRAAAVRSTILVESGHPIPTGASISADHRCVDLLAAAKWLRTES